MRAVVRCVLVTIGIAATVATGPAGVSDAAANQPHGFTIASVLPTRGEVVGVAYPVVVTFRAPVADRLAAERAIDIKSSPPMTGKYEWLDNDVAQWVPDRFWPAHTTIALSVGSLATSFQTGPAVVGVADLTAHTFTVSIDGVDAGPPSALPAPHHRPHWGEAGVFPASMGRAGVPDAGRHRTPSWARNAHGDHGFEQCRHPRRRSRRLPARRGLGRPHHQPRPLRAFGSVGRQFTRVTTMSATAASA